MKKTIFGPIITLLLPLLISCITANLLSDLLGWRREILVLVAVAFCFAHILFYYSNDDRQHYLFFFVSHCVLTVSFLAAVILSHFLKEPPLPLLTPSNVITLLIMIAYCAFYAHKLKESFQAQQPRK